MLIKKIKTISLFDVFLLVTLISLVVMAAFIFFKRSREFEVTVKITSKNVLYAWDTPPNWFAEYFHPGIMAKDSLGRRTAEIKKVYRYDNGPNNKTVYLTLGLKADYSWGSGKFSYEGSSLIVGAPIKIEFSNILVEGLITHIQGTEDPRPIKEVVVETQIMNYDAIFPETNGIPNFQAETIQVGEEIKDSLGQVLVTVVDKRVEPAKKIVSDSAGNLFIRPDPLKKDVYLTLKLRAKEVDNSINKEYYFLDDQRIKVGESVPLHLKGISVFPTITKIISIN